MSIATRFVSSTARPRLDLSGCVLYAPLWRPDLGGSTFTTIGDGGIPTHLCTVTGATWGTQGRMLNGTTDFISVPHSSSIDVTTNDFTIIAQIKCTGGTGNQDILYKRGASGGFWSMDLNTSGLLTTQLQDTVYARYVFNSSGDLRDSTPHQVAISFDRDGLATAYKDGVSIGTNDISSKSGTLANTGILALGRYPVSGSEYFIGLIGEAYKYNRALTAQEIQQAYLSTKHRYV